MSIFTIRKHESSDYRKNDRSNDKPNKHNYSIHNLNNDINIINVYKVLIFCCSVNNKKQIKMITPI